MTLAELIPSLRGLLQPRLEPGIWPTGTHLTTDGDVAVGGVGCTRLAQLYGTPTQVLAEAELRLRCRTYRAKLPAAETVYTAASMPCRAVLRWVDEERLSLCARSRQELAAARSVDFPAHRVLMRGREMTDADLTAALGYGVGRFVLGTFDDIERLPLLAGDSQAVLIAVAPGTGTGQGWLGDAAGDSRMAGFALADGSAEEAVRRVLAQPRLRLVGLYGDVGPHINRIGEYERAARRLVGLLGTIRDEYGVPLRRLGIAGGHPVRYTQDVPEFDLQGFATRLRGAINYECAARALPVPRLVVEPGQALVAAAGFTLCRVRTVARTTRIRVALDGPVVGPTAVGESPALRIVGRVPAAPPRPTRVDGVTHDVLLPDDVHPGDLVGIPCTGAHQHLDANPPTQAPPPVLAVAAGVVRVLTGPGTGDGQTHVIGAADKTNHGGFE